MAAGGGGVAAAAGVLVNGAAGRFVAPDHTLTPMQQAFVDAYVSNGCRATEAAEAAGYANPRIDGWRLLRNEAVKAAIRHARDARVPELQHARVELLLEIMRDKAQPAEARMRAADRAGEIVRELEGTKLDAGKADGKADGDTSPKVAQIMGLLREGQSVTLRSDAAPSTIDAQAIDIPYVNA